jgi:hypothetical protein
MGDFSSKARYGEPTGSPGRLDMDRHLTGCTFFTPVIIPAVSGQAILGLEQAQTTQGTGVGVAAP